MVLTGFNTDIEYGGVTYHVQTEDRRGLNPLIETLVYVGGEILASRRTEYRNLLEAGADEGAIKVLMERQHRAILEAIRTGRLDLLTQPSVSDDGDTTVVRRSPLMAPRQERPPVSTRSLDEVIAQYLAEQSRTVQLQLLVTGADKLLAGQPFSGEVQVVDQGKGEGVEGATVELRYLSTVTRPVLLGSAATDPEGKAAFSGTLPALEKGTGLVVVSAKLGNRGGVESKYLVQRSP